jgi:hypothetical protein
MSIIILQKPANLVMFGASYTRKDGYAFKEEPNIVIWRKAAATSINFSFTTSLP